MVTTDRGEFNTNFHSDRNKEIVSIIQFAVGCFHCNTKGGTLKQCTGCEFTQYCDKKCQSADWKNSNSNGGHRRLCKILRGVDPVVQATPNNMPRLYAGLGYLDEELLLNEMELYSDLFIEEAARIGVDSMSLVVLCAEDKNDITRLTVSARFLDGTFQIHEICGVLFKTIDIGRDKLDLIYPRDGGHGSIADDKKSLVVAHLEQFIDKLKVKGIQVVMMTCGRGLTWLASECPETQGRNLPSRMAG